MWVWVQYQGVHQDYQVLAYLLWLLPAALRDLQGGHVRGSDLPRRGLRRSHGHRIWLLHEEPAQGCVQEVRESARFLHGGQGPELKAVSEREVREWDPDEDGGDEPEVQQVREGVLWEVYVSLALGQMW